MEAEKPFTISALGSSQTIFQCEPCDRWVWLELPQMINIVLCIRCHKPMWSNLKPDQMKNGTIG